MEKITDCKKLIDIFLQLEERSAFKCKENEYNKNEYTCNLYIKKILVDGPCSMKINNSLFFGNFNNVIGEYSPLHYKKDDLHYITIHKNKK